MPLIEKLKILSPFQVAAWFQRRIDHLSVEPWRIPRFMWLLSMMQQMLNGYGALIEWTGKRLAHVLHCYVQKLRLVEVSQG